MFSIKTLILKYYFHVNLRENTLIPNDLIQNNQILIKNHHVTVATEETSSSPRIISQISQNLNYKM